MENVNVLLVLTEDNEILVTSLEDYNNEEFDEGEGLVVDYEFPVSIENAKSYGNGNREWEDVLDTFSNYELFEVESDWGENAIIFVK